MDSARLPATAREREARDLIEKVMAVLLKIMSSEGKKRVYLGCDLLETNAQKRRRSALL